MTADERKVLALLEDKDWHTVDQVANNLNFKKGVARMLLSRLWLRRLVMQSFEGDQLIFKLPE